MTNKELYKTFCHNTYIPIYSKPWWMDAICGENSWDVWLYENGGRIVAAMPYYKEKRGNYSYITKAPLTQNNGIIFIEDSSRKRVKDAELQEKVINAACDYIESLGLDVYEQQFMPSFENWTPFFWRHYTSIIRYTYVIPDTSNLDIVKRDFSAEYRNQIKKGQKLTHICEDLGPEEFYVEHEKIFLKQNSKCPFSIELWLRLYKACTDHSACKLLCARDEMGAINAVLFLVWDERTMYHLLGGNMPEFSRNQGYLALTNEGICYAHEKGLSYDFEGSMIKQIAKSFRQYGGIPKPYYRIRKVFNPNIVREEAEKYISLLESESER